MDTPAPHEIVCSAGGLAADAGTVDALARLQLAARRRGARLSVRDASADLQCLLVLLGLREALGVESSREAEQREEGGGVEKEGQLDDPAI